MEALLFMRELIIDFSSAKYVRIFVLSETAHEYLTFAFTHESGYTLSSPRKIAHSGSHAETWGFTLAIGGAFRSHSHIEAMKSRRKRMHALWRVSASYGTAAPLGCGNLFFCYSVVIFAPLPVWPTTGIFDQDY